MLAHQMKARAGRCSGWHCLTPAQQFGVIFSIVIIAVVLLGAWMYYLGKRATIYRAGQSLTLPGGRLVRQDPTLPTGVALGQLPVAQQWPGYPPQVWYQPVMYNFDPRSGHRAQPYSLSGPFPQGMMPHGVPKANSGATFPPTFHAQHPNSNLPAPLYLPQVQASQYPQTWPLSADPLSAPPHSQAFQPSQTKDAQASFDRGLPIRRPSVMQRLGRLLRMPMGRASTIASSSVQQTPRHSRNASMDSSFIRSNATGRPNQASARVRTSDDGQGTRRSIGSQTKPAEPVEELDDRESLQTDMATVHSDDYDLIIGSSDGARSRSNGQKLRGTRFNIDGHDTTVDDGSSVSEGYGDGVLSIPTASSLSLPGRAPEASRS